jgi:hypothetical protein
MNKELCNQNYLSFSESRLVFQGPRLSHTQSGSPDKKGEAPAEQLSVEQSNARAAEAVKEAEETVSRLRESDNPKIRQLATRLQSDMDIHGDKSVIDSIRGGRIISQELADSVSRKLLTRLKQITGQVESAEAEDIQFLPTFVGGDTYKVSENSRTLIIRQGEAVFKRMLERDGEAPESFEVVYRNSVFTFDHKPDELLVNSYNITVPNSFPDESGPPLSPEEIEEMLRQDVERPKRPMPPAESGGVTQ